MYPPFNSGDRQALARDRWPILVSLLGRLVRTSHSQPYMTLNRFNPLLAGNSSSLLATSGMSSGAVVLTGGQYGFVTSGTFVGLPAFHEPRADLLGQIYSIARLATLASVTMDLIMNNTNLTDCQVCLLSTSLHPRPYPLHP